MWSPAAATRRFARYCWPKWVRLILACFIAFLANNQLAIAAEANIAASHIAIFNPPRFFEGINKIYDSIRVDSCRSSFEPFNCLGGDWKWGSVKSLCIADLLQFPAWAEMRSGEILGGCDLPRFFGPRLA